jgi:hypothetical protein
VIYLLSDWIVRLLEKRRGAALKQRQVIFFVVFLSLALITFNALQKLFSNL